jgi:molybdate transport system permease protein
VETVLPPLLLTLRVAAASMVLIAAPALAAAYLLARRDFRGKAVLSTFLTLPLVLPPTAIGFLLLSVFAYDGPLGRSTLGFDPGVLLTWKGAVLAQSVLAMPLVVRTARVAFEGVDPRLEAMARTLGHGPWAVFVRFTVPLAARGLTASLILGFTRAIGEFGATVIVAGNIPGRTQTLASAIYGAQQAGRGEEAGILVGAALLLGFSAVYVAERLGGRPK